MRSKKNFKVVKTFNSRLEAEIAKGKLEVNGILSFITADDARGMRPFPFQYTAGVQLHVEEKNLKKALQLLHTQEK